MKFIYFTILTCLLANISCSTTKTVKPNNQKIETSIRMVMKQQQNDWNTGDLDAFMQGYWKSDSLRFVSNFKVTYGWQATLDNYKRGYPSKEAMGKLKFDLMDFDILSSEAAIVLGRYTLEYPSGPVTGLFTLTWKKLNNQWKIVSDMTCG